MYSPLRSAGFTLAGILLIVLCGNVISRFPSSPLVPISGWAAILGLGFIGYAILSTFAFNEVKRGWLMALLSMILLCLVGFAIYRATIEPFQQGITYEQVTP